jgi:hypothetical protein
MAAQPVTVRRILRDNAWSTLESDLARVQRLASWLDTRYNIAGVRFGFDSIIGLIPGIGDTLMTLVGMYPIAVARKHRLGAWVQARMGLNLLGDWLIGLVPVLGDLFDVGFKAHARNARILEDAAAKARQ